LVAELIANNITHDDVESVVGGLIMDNKDYKNNTGYVTLDNATEYIRNLLNILVEFLNASKLSVTDTANNVIDITSYKKDIPVKGEEKFKKSNIKDLASIVNKPVYDEIAISSPESENDRLRMQALKERKLFLENLLRLIVTRN
jgi:hypothetical protein